MKLIQRNKDSAYLQFDKYVNFDHPLVEDKAKELAAGCKSTFDIIKAVYYFVRDEIPHTWDSKDSTITISASDVLEKGTGICYSKANLLAALMRYNGIYTGFCYQRIKYLSSENKFALHALNAVYEPDLRRWIRLDARGNNLEINADFTINETQLGFVIRPEIGEFEFEDLIAVPLP
ncbi:MAG: transglutaminase family protein, partial [Coprococcus sp.]